VPRREKRTALSHSIVPLVDERAEEVERKPDLLKKRKRRRTGSLFSLHPDRGEREEAPISARRLEGPSNGAVSISKERERERRSLNGGRNDHAEKRLRQYFPQISRRKEEREKQSEHRPGFGLGGAPRGEER